VEAQGAANSPTILSWAAETGLNHDGYNADSVPWCGLFMALVAERAGYAFPAHPLWALNWQSFGTEEHQPLLGDVLVFVRPEGGHVGLYIGEDAAAYHVLGGNTSDAVKIARIAKTRLKAARAPLYKIGRPATAKPYVLASGGAALSRDEK
jgi:uncharacterized protein (TIGR02594 family)